MVRMADKTDFRKELDSYRAKAGEFRLLEVPDLRYLMVDGHGDPNTSIEPRRRPRITVPACLRPQVRQQAGAR